MSRIRCGTIDPNRIKVAGKPNRVMTPEVKNASIWADRKNDYKRNKEKEKLRRYSNECESGGVSFLYSFAISKRLGIPSRQQRTAYQGQVVL